MQNEYIETRDADGKLVMKRLYNPEGTMLEHYEYRNETLVFSIINDTVNYYYEDVAPQVIKMRIVHNNNHKDLEKTFFDKNGQQLYAVRNEEISDTYARRYYNGILVAEGSFNVDDFVAKYYSPEGSLIIEYNGIWKKQDQQIAFTNTREDYMITRWDAFLPNWLNYNENTLQSDWQTVHDNFENCYQHFETMHKLQAMPEFPMYINGMLAEDENVADMCARKIWMDIEDEGPGHNTAYKVVSILAKTLPQQPTHIQQRIRNFFIHILQYAYVERTEIEQIIKAAL